MRRGESTGFDTFFHSYTLDQAKQNCAKDVVTIKCQKLSTHAHHPSRVCLALGTSSAGDSYMR